jgi:methylase of polypeptide subunit release factors
LPRGIFGVDVSRFATHLSTINLAVRDLVDAQNYPRVVRSDFFDLEHDRPLLRLPGPGGEEIQIRADALDAIVANPPYVRQEEIPKKDKERYRSLVKREVQLEASGRSDLHVFFGGMP